MCINKQGPRGAKGEKGIMQKPKPTSDDYGHGQMMGMLVVIQMYENAQSNGVHVPEHVIDTIKRIASDDLGEFLGKHPEDVHLLVEQQLKETIQ